MVTTTHLVDEEAIDQFKDTVTDLVYVTRAIRKPGQKVVKVTVDKNENGAPNPVDNLFEYNQEAGKWVGDEFAVARLTGGGNAPGNKYTWRFAIFPVCEKCESDGAERRVSDDSGRYEMAICEKCFRGFFHNLPSEDGGRDSLAEPTAD